MLPVLADRCEAQADPGTPHSVRRHGDGVVGALGHVVPRVDAQVVTNIQPGVSQQSHVVVGQ